MDEEEDSKNGFSCVDFFTVLSPTLPFSCESVNLLSRFYSSFAFNPYVFLGSFKPNLYFFIFSSRFSLVLVQVWSSLGLILVQFYSSKGTGLVQFLVHFKSSFGPVLV